MAEYNSLLATINANIKQNGNQEITGTILNGVLRGMVDAFGEGYQYIGLASPDTTYTTGDKKVFFVAATAGTYTDLGGAVLVDGEVAIIRYDTAWHKDSIVIGLSDADKAKLWALPTNAQLELLLAAKANIDGYYESMGVGYAKNLLGNGRGVLGEFSFRPSGGTADIGTGIASFDEIRGNSVVWNQLLAPEVFPNTSLDNGSFAKNADGSYTIVVNAGGLTTNNLISSTNVKLTTGHTYFVAVTGNIDSHITFRHSGTINAQSNSIFTYQGTSESQSNFFPRIASGMSEGEYKIYINLFDLTLMGIADKITIPEDFTALYGSGYKEYNPGTAISFKGEGLKAIGVNQWDEEWEVGALSASGDIDKSLISRRTTSFIRVYAGKTYFATSNARKGRAEYYDSNKVGVQHFDNGVPTNGIMSIPQGVAYMRITLPSSYGTTYNHDIQIALYHSGGEIPTTYHPYEEHTLALPITTAKASGVTIFPDGARSAGTAYDNFHTIVNGAFTKATKRIGVVDLGSRLYTYQNNEITTVSAITDAAAATGSTDTIVRVLCAKFVAVSINDRSEAIGARCYIDASKVLHFRDSGITSAAAFKAAMAGVLLFYELATPVDYTLDEPIPVNYNVNDWGTEMLLPQGVDENGVPKTTPIIASIVYAPNVVDAIRNLPKNFASIAASGSSTIGSLLAALKAINVIGNYTITWDATTNTYQFTIAPAVQ